MIDLTVWLAQFRSALADCFGDRVWFLGLQGSYGRGEATETSDIDLVVILDRLTPEDIHRYGAMLDTLPHRDKICGFLSGKQEILRWDAADLFQFCHDTKPILGSLSEALARVDGDAVNRAIKTGACNIYHGCVHNMLYEKDEDMIRGLYKGASFVLQAIAFRKTGTYFTRQADLLTVLDPEDQEIARTFLALKAGAPVAFREMSGKLVSWAANWIGRTE